MDQSSLRRSKMIKHMHVVVWILLLSAGGILGSRVVTSSRSSSFLAEGNVRTIAEKDEVNHGRSVVRGRDSSVSKRVPAKRLDVASKPETDTLPPTSSPERMSDSDWGSLAVSATDEVDAAHALSATPRETSSDSKQNSRSRRTIAIGSIYEPDVLDLVDASDGTVDDTSYAAKDTYSDRDEFIGSTQDALGSALPDVLPTVDGVESEARESEDDRWAVAVVTTESPSDVVAPEESQPAVDEAGPRSASEPAVIEPAAIEPAVIEPAVIEPAVIEPAVIEPAVIEPAVIEPAVIEPAVIEPAVIEPAVIEPAIIEPAVIEPAVIEPAVIEPAIIEPATERPAGFVAATTDRQPGATPAAVEDSSVTTEGVTESQTAVAVTQSVQAGSADQPTTDASNERTAQAKDHGEPAEATLPARLTIENPKRIGYPVSFLYGVELIQLQPGEVFTRMFAGAQEEPKRVLFHRGGDFGDVSMQLEPLGYEFKVTRQGWTIVLSKKNTSSRLPVIEQAGILDASD